MSTGPERFSSSFSEASFQSLGRHVFKFFTLSRTAHDCLINHSSYHLMHHLDVNFWREAWLDIGCSCYKRSSTLTIRKPYKWCVLHFHSKNFIPFFEERSHRRATVEHKRNVNILLAPTVLVLSCIYYLIVSATFEMYLRWNCQPTFAIYYRSFSGTQRYLRFHCCSVFGLY